MTPTTDSLIADHPHAPCPSPPSSPSHTPSWDQHLSNVAVTSSYPPMSDTDHIIADWSSMYDDQLLPPSTLSNKRPLSACTAPSSTNNKKIKLSDVFATEPVTPHASSSNLHSSPSSSTRASLPLPLPLPLLNVVMPLSPDPSSCTDHDHDDHTTNTNTNTTHRDGLQETSTPGTPQRSPHNNVAVQSHGESSNAGSPVTPCASAYNHLSRLHQDDGHDNDNQDEQCCTTNQQQQHQTNLFFSCSDHALVESQQEEECHVQRSNSSSYGLTPPTNYNNNKTISHHHHQQQAQSTLLCHSQQQDQEQRSLTPMSYCASPSPSASQSHPPMGATTTSRTGATRAAPSSYGGVACSTKVKQSPKLQGHNMSQRHASSSSSPSTSSAAVIVAVPSSLDGNCLTSAHSSLASLICPSSPRWSSATKGHPCQASATMGAQEQQQRTGSSKQQSAHRRALRRAALKKARAKKEEGVIVVVDEHDMDNNMIMMMKKKNKNKKEQSDSTSMSSYGTRTISRRAWSGTGVGRCISSCTQEEQVQREQEQQQGGGNVDKKAARAIRNREAAMKSRIEAKAKLRKLEDERNQLKGRVRSLAQENERLLGQVRNLMKHMMGVNMTIDNSHDVKRMLDL